jgi:hypothetical protein
MSAEVNGGRVRPMPGINPVLIDTPKRLEIAVTYRKKWPTLVSNRNKIDPSSAPI